MSTPNALIQPLRYSDVFFYEDEQEFARYCREPITVLSGAGKLTVGTVLGRIATSTATSAAKSGGNTGNGTMGSVTVSAGALAGIYKLRVDLAATNAGHFRVVDPNGNEIGEGDVAAAFSAGGLALTLADGSTDFIVGDGFDITVAAGSGKYVPVTFAATDGSQLASAVLVTQLADATSADASAVAVVGGAGISVILKTGAVVWPSGASSPQKAAALAQLAALGIKSRQEV